MQSLKWLLLISLVLPMPALGARQNCFQEPAADGCASYTVNSSKALADLETICKPSFSTSNTSGWPSACTLHWECSSSKPADEAYCAPLRLLLTACSHTPQLPSCAKYLKLCSAESKVEQCMESQPIASLPNATQAYVDVLSLCTSSGSGSIVPAPSECTRCSAGASRPGSVSLQSVSLSCPDPLGSLSALCKGSARSAACSGWEAFCWEAGPAFPSLCGEGWEALPSPGPSPAPCAAEPATSSPSPAMPVAPMTAWAAGQPLSAGLDCYEAPGDPACAGFRHPDDASREQIAILCSAMPGMVGCTLWASCQDGTASGKYCAPFSILGDICTDMPSMRGCEGYMGLCANASSVVRQCSRESPIQHVLLSDEVVQAVLGMCGTHAMPQCAECPARHKCPDPLSTLSAMCLDMPGMSECSRFYEMCEEAGATFKALCGGTGSGDSAGLPPMKMYLHQSVADIILLKSWVPHTTGAYAASCIAVLVVAVLVQALKAWRLTVELRWSQRRAMLRRHLSQGPSAAGQRASSGGDSDASGIDVPLLRRQHFMSNGQARRNAVRSLFTVGIVFLDYMLMLVVMTFNVGIIVAAVVGFGIGALLFGHMGETPQRQGGLLVLPEALDGGPDPDPESLQVQFASQQQVPCCTGH